MNMLKRDIIKKIVNTILLCLLLVLYCIFYVDLALEQYMKKRTTIVARRENIQKMDSPIFIICPDPPFKTKSLVHITENKDWGTRYFWYIPSHFSKNDFIDAMELYMNMSYKLDKDIIISHHVIG